MNIDQVVFALWGKKDERLGAGGQGEEGGTHE